MLEIELTFADSMAISVNHQIFLNYKTKINGTHMYVCIQQFAESLFFIHH